MGFKEDADFARFVAMGAVGAAVAADVLRERHGHRPIELERYAMANKVWQTKVKRLRLPDLVCTRCGLRVEARAKSKLAVVLSHSDSPGRRWDEGGMRDTDLYAFMRVRSDPEEFPPVVAEPVWFSTAALRATAEHAKPSSRKSQSEGSEVTLSWNSWSPKFGGTFERVDEDGRIIVHKETGRRMSYWQWRDWPGDQHLYMEPGEQFEPGEQLVAGIVAPPGSLACPGTTWDLAAAVQSPDDVERLAAIRAISSDSESRAVSLLSRVARDAEEDWRIRLEAQIGLARSEPATWVPLIYTTASSSDEQDRSMEAALALAEIEATEALEALCDLAANESLHEDLRAAAAWGAGQGAAANPDRLLPLILDDTRLVALHAAAAMDSISEAAGMELLAWLSSDDQHRAVAAANVLARNGRVDVLIDAYELGEPTRSWALYALGGMDASIVRCRAGARLTDELRWLLEPMWLREFDWLQRGDDPLSALDLQKLRFDPKHPTLGDL